MKARQQQDPCMECEKSILCSECEVFMAGNPGIVSLPPKTEMKQCSTCKLLLPLDDFHCSSTKADGRQNICKSCKRVVDRARREKIKGVKSLFEITPQEKHNIASFKQIISEGTREDTLQGQCRPYEPKSIEALCAMLDRMEAEERETLRAKGNDYSGDNRLANFERIAAEMNLKPEMVLWIYFKKHTDRLRTYIIDGAVSSESVVDSILDCRNYLALLRLMIETKA